MHHKVRKMRSIVLLLFAAALYAECNCQFTDFCLPRPMREVPITLQIKGAANLQACGEDGLLSIPELASMAEAEITRNYQPPPTCSLVSLVHTSCKAHGRRGQRVVIQYMANMTCGGSCYHIRESGKDSDTIEHYYNMVDALVDTTRIKSGAEFNYNGRNVEIFYFKGRKGDVFPVCGDPAPLQDDVNKKIPSCKCPSSCADPCTLPPETGLCRAYIPSYFHNSSSGQCEQFIYGGCGGNQNRFESREDCEVACKATVNDCPEGMVYNDCGSACPVTCDNKDDVINCIAVCVSGCFCEEGSVLLEAGGEVCVAPEVCPVKECPEGMVYQECGTACPTTCDNKDDALVPCTLQCVQGCFCEEGSVLLEAGGEVCVAPKVCPLKECPEGMVYQECGTACTTTCDNKDDVVICSLQCVQGCFCNGTTILLEDESEKCVAPGDCPVKEEEECPEGMVYQECGTACPTTCDNKYIDALVPCTLQCVQGCFCEKGSVLLEAGGEVCVDPEVCPGKEEEECPEGMVYQECGTACPTTCDNKDDLIICTSQCVPGCFCNGTTILLEDGSEKCVAPGDCPVKEECPEGKVYDGCGSACPLTCENKDDDIICTKQCVPGCFCPKGYVEQNNTCVLPEDCEAVAVDLCTLPPETGPCEALFHRYFYNSSSGQCEDFIYGGCRGNENNFMTVDECEDKCKEQECPEGMVYQECGTACPTTCDNKDDALVPCTLQCVQGCFCEEGSVLLEEEGKVCIDQAMCPGKEEEECPEGMVYQECGTACPTTCDNKDDVIICTQECVQGCFCDEDTILLEGGGKVCVAEDQCPASNN